MAIGLTSAWNNNQRQMLYQIILIFHYENNGLQINHSFTPLLTPGRHNLYNANLLEVELSNKMCISRRTHWWTNQQAMMVEPCLTFLNTLP